MTTTPRTRMIGTALLLALLPFVGGCGLMFGGTRQPIRTTSSPEGAMVTTSPATVEYRTPTVLNLERKNSYILEFSMPGYTTQKAEIQRKMRGGIVVLDVLVGLVGVIVDAATGAWYKLEPEVTSVTLTKVSPDTPGPATITVSFDAKPTKNLIAVRASVPGVIVHAIAN